jgi:integrase
LAEAERPPPPAAPSSRERKSASNRDLLLAALERSGWSNAGAAKLLGYSPSTFSRRLGEDPELRAVTKLRIADMVHEEREAKGDVEIAAKKLDLLRAHREAMKGSAGFGQMAFLPKGAPGIAIGMKRLQSFASAIGLPPRKLRGLRWDIDMDLAAAVVRRPSGEALKLSQEAVDLLQKRRDGMKGYAAAGDLLFPSDVGGFVSPSCLDKPFRTIAEAAKIRKFITPKAMRRTAQDLSRLAGVNDLVTRAVSGHSDVAMQELYSTIRGDEMRKSLAAVVQLVGLP